MEQENDPWAMFPDAPETAQDDPWAAFPDADVATGPSDIPSFSDAPTPITEEEKAQLENAPEPTLMDRIQYWNPFSDQSPNAASNSNFSEEFSQELRGAANQANVPGAVADFGAGAVGGALNAVPNAIVTGAALSDQVLGTQGAEQWNNALPRYIPSEGTADQVGAALGEVVPGVMVGGAGARAIGGMLPRGTQTVGKLAAGEAGAVATMSPGTKPMFVGDDATALSLGSGFSGGDKKDFSGQLLREKGNLALEGGALSAGMAGVGRAISTGGGILKDAAWDPIKRIFSLKSQNELAASPIVDAVRTMKPELANKPVKETIDFLNDAIQKNGTIEINGRKINRDTVSAIEESLDPKKDANLIATLRSIRKGGEGPSSPNLETTMSTPAAETKDFLSQTNNALGGDQAIEASRGAVASQGRQQVNNAAMDVAGTQVKLNDASRTLSDVMKKNDVLGEDLGRISDTGDLNTLADLPNRANAITDAVSAETQKVRSEFKTLVDAIPETDTITNVREYDNILKEVYNDANVPDSLKDAIENAGEGYKALYETVLPEINKFVRAGFDNVTLHDTNARLRALQKTINEGVPDGPAKVASDYYKDVMAPMINDGPVGRIDDIYMDTVNRGGQQPYNYRTQTFNEVTQAMGHATDHAQVIDVLQKSGDAKLATDYIMGEMVSKLAGGASSASTKMGDISQAVSISDIVSAAKRYLPALKKADPEQFAKLDAFVKDIQKSNGDISKLTADLKVAEQTYKDVTDSVYSNKLKEFFTKTGEEVPNGYQAFKDVIMDPQGANRLNNLVDIVNKSDDQLAKDGIKAAYMKALDEYLYTSSTDIVGNARMGKESWRNIRDNIDPILEHGKLIFKDEPKVMADTEALIRESGRILDSRGAIPMLQAAPGLEREGKGAVGMIVTHIWGVLNRMGAKVRMGAGTVIGNMDPDRAFLSVRDNILSDARNFSEVLSKYPGSKGEMSPQVRNYIRNVIANSTGTRPSDVETEEALGSGEDKNKKEGSSTPLEITVSPKKDRVK